MEGCRLIPLHLLMLLTCFSYFMNQELAPNPCDAGKVPCDNFQCVLFDKWCDKEEDCLDRSDEKYCRKTSWFSLSEDPNECLPEKHFLCKNGVCVPLSTKCDGIENCKDGSDEDWCDISTTPELSPEEDSTKTTFSIFRSKESIFESAEDTSTSEENTEMSFTTLEMDQTSQVSTISTSAWSRNNNQRTSEIPETSSRTGRITPSTVSYHKTSHRPNISARNHYETPQRPRTPHSYVTELSYYEIEIAKAAGYNSPQYPPHHTNRIDSNSRHSTISPTDTPVPQHIANTWTPRTNGHRSQYPELPNFHRSHYPGQENVRRTTSLRPDANSYRSTRQFPNGYESQHIVRLHRRSFHSPMEHSPTPRSNAPSHSYPEYKPKRVLPRFYFHHNYTARFAHQYTGEVRQAEEWIMEQRKDSYDWGKDTPRALIALSLVHNSFLFENAENEFMKRRLETHLGMKLLKLKSNSALMTDSRLAIYVNALLATCQDPKNFLGEDLTEMLLARKNRSIGNHTGINPTVYIALCLTNTTIQWQDIQTLSNLLNSNSRSEAVRDKQILATTALACFQQLDAYKYNHELKTEVDKAYNLLLRKKLSNGSFGSIYSTALAAQALMSMNISSSYLWDARATLDYLKGHQLEDGSFGDMLSTYYILPALSGRSLLHLRNIRCDEIPAPTGSDKDDLDIPGPRINIFITLKVDNPVTLTATIPLSIPRGDNFFKAMKKASDLNSQFRFLSEEYNNNINIHTIADIPNDTERGYHWHLYIIDGTSPADVWVDLKRDMRTEDISQLIPEDHDEFIYWYLRL